MTGFRAAAVVTFLMAAVIPARVATAESPSNGMCSPASTHSLFLDVLVDGGQFTSPLTQRLRIVFPAASWEARALTGAATTSREYRTALECVFAPPAVERDINSEGFGGWLRLHRQPELSIADGKATVVVDEPENWLWASVAPSGRRLLASIGSRLLPAGRRLQVTLDAHRARFARLTPPPDRFDGSTHAVWVFHADKPDGAWVAAPTADLIQVAAQPGFGDSLSLYARQGQALPMLEQLLWFFTWLALPIGALVLLLTRMRRAGGGEREKAMRGVVAIVAFGLPAVTILIFRPAAYSFRLPHDRVQAAVAFGVYALPALGGAWVSRRRSEGRRPGHGWPTVFVLVAAAAAVTSLPTLARAAGFDSDKGLSLSTLLMPLPAWLATYALLAGSLMVAVGLWPGDRLWPVGADGEGGIALPRLQGWWWRLWVALAAAFVTAHVAAEVIQQLAPWSRPHRWHLGSQAALSRAGLDYPTTMLYQLMSALLLIALLALLQLLRARQHTHARPTVMLEPFDLWVVALLFGGLVGGGFSWLVGFPLPLGIALVTLLVRYLAFSDAIDSLVLRVQASSNESFLDHRRELIDRAAVIERTTRELAALDDAGDEVEKAEARRQQLLARIALLERNETPNGSLGLELPDGVVPERLALMVGPCASGWDNGVLAVRRGAVLALLPFAYSIYQLVDRQHLLGLDMQFGPLWFLVDLLREAAYWLVAAFVLGFAYPYLRGRNGVVKGLALGGTYVVAAITSAVVGASVLNLQIGTNVFRVAELVLFLAVLGITIDLDTLRECGGVRVQLLRSLTSMYQLHDVRRAVGYASPLLLAAIAVGQQLLTGHSGGAVVELIKNLPAIPGK